MSREHGFQRRNTKPEQFRAVEEGGKRYIEGYFAVFGSKYEMFPGASESVAPEAFDRTLDRDIRALIDHESRLVMGRTKAGTLELRVDSHGLWGRIEINENDTDAMNLYARVQRGDVSQCSFGFEIIREDVEINEATGHVHWTLREVRLWEVSVVTFPAYEETGVEARKQEFGDIQSRRVAAWKARMKGRLKNGTEAGIAGQAH